MKISFHQVAFFLIFFCSSSLYAQKKQIAGYYISLEGDTVKGEFPNYSQWNKNPAKVEFIVQGSGANMHLTPLNTHKFVVEGYDEYIAYSGSRLLNPIEDQILLNDGFTISPADVEEKVNVFLRVVAKTTGSNLYMLYDSKRVNFFFHVPGDTVVELRYKKSIEANRITEMAEYRDQLRKSFAKKIEENNLSPSLRKLSYKEATLASFFLDLNSGVNMERKKKNSQATWVLSAGLAMNNIKLTSKKPLPIPMNYNASFSPILSVGYYGPIARKFGKYFLYPQLSISRYKITGETKNNPYIISNTFKADLLIGTQVSAGVNFINEDNFKFFLAAGFGGIFQIGAENIREIYLSSSDTPEDKVTFSMRNTNYLIEASTGVSWGKKFLISASYMFPVAVSSFAYYSTRLSGFQLKMGYMLK